MVNIKHDALCALKQNALVIGFGCRQKAPALSGKGQKLVTHSKKIGIDRLGIGLWLTSRACVSRVMHREGNLAYSTVCLWLVMMVVVQDVLMAGSCSANDPSPQASVQP